MSKIITFKPLAQVTAQKQVEEFIKFAKRLTALDQPNMPLDWNKNDWGGWKNLTFLKAGLSSKKALPSQAKQEYWLDHGIIDFAKAYMRYTLSLKDKDDPIDIAAIRCLEPALLDLKGRADITLIDEDVLDEAVIYIKKHYSAGRAYRVGNVLQKLVEFVTEKQMVVRPIVWNNPIKRTKDLDKGHRERKEDAKKKMPKPEMLDALAEIFSSKPTHHRDIITTSMAAILVSAPARAGELLELKKDCILWKHNHTDEKNELHMAYYGQKGFGHHDKPVPATMAQVCVEAINRVIDITEGARQLAKCLEDNPDEFPFHKRLPAVSQDSILTPEQCLDALNLGYGSNATATLREWLKSRLGRIQKSKHRAQMVKTEAILGEALAGLPVEEKDGDFRNVIYTLTLRKLNTYLREYTLPPYFPYVSKKRLTKYSEALFCIFRNQLVTDSVNRSAVPYELGVLNNNYLTDDFGDREATEGNIKKSIFTRWGYIGEQFEATSHQFRHYLNTLAQKGAVGEIEIARWSGRADVSQNATYNHMSPEEFTDRMRSVGVGSQTNLAVKSMNNMPITVEELEADGERIAHVTLYGACVHDFSMEPCQKHRDCLNCREHRCIKGDQEKLKRVKSLRDKIKTQLRNAQIGSDEGFLGADRWLRLYMDKLDRANQLVEILEDPNIEDGAVIHMAVDVHHSPIKRVLNEAVAVDRLAIGSDKPQPKQDINRLRQLLGR